MSDEMMEMAAALEVFSLPSQKAGTERKILEDTELPFPLAEPEPPHLCSFEGWFEHASYSDKGLPDGETELI